MLVEEMEIVIEFFLVMELVKGGDFFDVIILLIKYIERDGSVMVYNLVNVFRYFYGFSIVYRDIKLENFLVCEYFDGIKFLKLGDFGFVIVVEGFLYIVCGIFIYVVLEIIVEIGYGLKVDIWVVGVIIYIFFCGFLLF